MRLRGPQQQQEQAQQQGVHRPRQRLQQQRLHQQQGLMQQHQGWLWSKGVLGKCRLVMLGPGLSARPCTQNPLQRNSAGRSFRGRDRCSHYCNTNRSRHQCTLAGCRALQLQGKLQAASSPNSRSRSIRLERTLIWVGSCHITAPL